MTEQEKQKLSEVLDELDKALGVPIDDAMRENIFEDMDVLDGLSEEQKKAAFALADTISSSIEDMSVGMAPTQALELIETGFSELLKTGRVMATADKKVAFTVIRKDGEHYTVPHKAGVLSGGFAGLAVSVKRGKVFVQLGRMPSVLFEEFKKRIEDVLFQDECVTNLPLCFTDADAEPQIRYYYPVSVRYLGSDNMMVAIADVLLLDYKSYPSLISAALDATRISVQR